MILCPKCKSKEEDIGWLFICYGDGICDKHGRFSFDKDVLKEYCYECAKEENICQMCGKNVL